MAITYKVKQKTIANRASGTCPEELTSPWEYYVLVTSDSIQCHPHPYYHPHSHLYYQPPPHPYYQPHPHPYAIITMFPFPPLFLLTRDWTDSWDEDTWMEVIFGV